MDDIGKVNMMLSIVLIPLGGFAVYTLIMGSIHVAIFVFCWAIFSLMLLNYHPRMRHYNDALEEFNKTYQYKLHEDTLIDEVKT